MRLLKISEITNKTIWSCDSAEEKKERLIMKLEQRITLEAGKRGGKPCIRGLRITVYDVLEWLASGMSHAEIIEDFPELELEDIQASLLFASDREHSLKTLLAA